MRGATRVVRGTGFRLQLHEQFLLLARRLQTFFNAPDPLRVVFTPNVTYALNLVIKGLLKPGDRVVTCSMEHNSVMRPLRALEREGIELHVTPCKPDGGLDLESMKAAILPGTRLVVTTHASNVTGTLLPVTEVALLPTKNPPCFY